MLVKITNFIVSRLQKGWFQAFSKQIVDIFGGVPQIIIDISNLIGNPDIIG